MSEKLYAFLLKLYPDDFRRTYGGEALRLVRDRARVEKGFLSRLRLWLDLLCDLAMSLPREYSQAPTAAIAAASGEQSFQLLAEPSPAPALLRLGGTLSAVLFWACVFVVAHGGGFPVLFPALDLSAHSVSTNPYTVCITAPREIPANSAQPLFAFRFAPPGASGVALIDGNVVRAFNNERYVSIRAHVLAGDHQFALELDRPAETALISNNGDFEFCQAK